MARLAAILLLALALPLGGCASLRSWTSGCPGVYSGVRYTSELWPWLPFDGRVFYGLDVPFSALVDTLAVPVTAFVGPREAGQAGVVRGCHWAHQKRQRGGS